MLRRQPVFTRSGPEKVRLPSVPMPYVAPRKDTERQIVDVWRDMFHIDRIGVTDIFFELRGDSLLAVQIIPSLGERFGVDLNINEVMEAPELGTLVSMIEDRRVSALERSFIVVKFQEGDVFAPPLFCIHPAGGGGASAT